MITALCFKWFDPEGRWNKDYLYTADYVNKLASMLRRNLTLPHRLMCCTDDPAGIDPSVQIVPLPGDVKALGSMNPKLYAFHPDSAWLFGERILMLDLDCVITGNIDALVDRPEPFIAWSVPEASAGQFNTSMVLMDAGAFPEVWSEFDPERSLGEMRAAGFEGWEQDWVSLKVGSRGAKWARSGEGIESFTPNRYRPLPEFARIVFFPGRASPGMAECQSAAPWIKNYWR